MCHFTIRIPLSPCSRHTSHSLLAISATVGGRNEDKGSEGIKHPDSKGSVSVCYKSTVQTSGTTFLNISRRGKCVWHRLPTVHFYAAITVCQPFSIFSCQMLLSVSNWSQTTYFGGRDGIGGFHIHSLTQKLHWCPSQYQSRLILLPTKEHMLGFVKGDGEEGENTSHHFCSQNPGLSSIL